MKITDVISLQTFDSVIACAEEPKGFKSVVDGDHHDIPMFCECSTIIEVQRVGAIPEPTSMNPYLYGWSEDYSNTSCPENIQVISNEV